MAARRIHLKRRIGQFVSVPRGADPEMANSLQELNRNLIELSNAMEQMGFDLQGDADSPLTTKGDIYTRDSAGDDRLAVGKFRQRLTPDVSADTGLEWSDDADGFELISGVMPDLYAHADDFTGGATWKTRVGPDLEATGAPTVGTGWDGLPTVDFDGSVDYFSANSLAAGGRGTLQHPFVAIMAVDPVEDQSANQTFFAWGDADTDHSWKAVYAQTTSYRITYRTENDAGSGLSVTGTDHPTERFIFGVVHDGTNVEIWTLSAAGFVNNLPPTADTLTGDFDNVDTFTVGAVDRSSDTNFSEMSVRLFAYWDGESVSSETLKALMYHATRRGAHVDTELQRDALGFEEIAGSRPVSILHGDMLPPSGNISSWPAVLGPDAGIAGTPAVATSWNGKRTARLDGSTDYLTLHDIAAKFSGNIQVPITVVMALQQHATTGFRTFWALGYSADSSPWKFFRPDTADDATFSIRNDADTSDTADESINITEDGSPMIIGVTYDGKNVTARMLESDGWTTLLDDVTMTTTGVATFDQFTYGVLLRTTPSSYAQIDIRGAVVFDAAVSVDVLDALMEHWTHVGAPIYRTITKGTLSETGNATLTETTTYAEMNAVAPSMSGNEVRMDESGGNARLTNTGLSVDGRALGSFSIKRTNGTQTSITFTAELRKNGTSITDTEREFDLLADEETPVDLHTPDPVTLAQNDYISIYYKVSTTWTGTLRVKYFNLSFSEQEQVVHL